jgi:phospholipid/cholesterol/gamma-HCH transport system permease protein
VPLLNVIAMPAPDHVTATPETRVRLHVDGEWLLVELQGAWRITERRPSWMELLAAAGNEPVRVKFVWGALADWDSALLLFVFEVRQWCRVKGVYCDPAASIAGGERDATRGGPFA